MIKIDNNYFLDFTEELLPVIVSLNFLVPGHEIEKEFLNIYRAYLKEEKRIEFASPCIVSVDESSLLAKYLEKLKNESKFDLSENPFLYRNNNYIILNWPLDEPKITR